MTCAPRWATIAAMHVRAAWLLLPWLLACGQTENDSPVKPQPPSQVARIAAQACACTTLACLRPLQTQLAGIAAAQHTNGNATAEHAEATNKVSQCAARLAAAQ